jgi:hypothetical protein
LTVQQPWAWAIVHGGKDVENRTQAWGYRGPLAIHAGQRWSSRGEHSPLVAAAYFDARQRQGWLVMDREGAPRRAAEVGLGRFVDEGQFGAIVGVVDLVDAHLAETCVDADGATCSAWAESSYAEHGGRTRRDPVHLVLENPRPLAEPIPCRGALGLWTPPAQVLAELEAAG